MIDFVFCPRWFYGKDLVIDVISTLVLFLIAYVSLKYYRLTDKKNKKYFYFAISFVLIGLSFIAKIFTNFNIYYDFISDNYKPVVELTMRVVKSTNIFYYSSLLLYRLLTLFGLYLLYSIYQEYQSRGSKLLFIFFVIVTACFSHPSYWLFHVTAFLFLALLGRHYILRYLETDNKHTKSIGISFSVIALSQAVFVFSWLSSILYAIAEIIQLCGYVLLLFTFIGIMKDGKKKKQN